MPYCPECSASVPQGAETCPTCGAALIDTPTTGEDEAALPAVDVKSLEKQLAAALAPRYELLKLLGAGGMGAVFLAREPALKRLVAVKVLAPHLAADPPARARFQREARAAAALSHPNVVRVYAVGETKNKLPYIVMQYVEGAPLADWLRQRGRVPERDARRIIGEVAAALAAAHARHLVHRDVKPANVLIEAESGRAFVADFGVSAALSAAARQETKLTATGMIIGTPPYMSPEQAAGDAVTPKSDVYSLGVLAYELLTGALPFTANTTAGWAAAHLRDTPEPVTKRRSELTPQLERMVARCLAKAPAERPAASEVARALLPSLETEIRWPPPGLSALLGRGHTLSRELLITVTAGLVVLLALAFTPDVLEVHERWLSRFTIDQLSGTISRAGPPPADTGPVSFFVWQTALILGSTIFLIGIVYLAAVVYWLRRAFRYRALGWNWLTLWDVAADHDGRSGALLAGGAEFGFLDETERQGILRARRLRVAWLLAAELWVFITLGTWIVAAALGFLGRQGPTPLADTTRLLIALVPLALLLIVADRAARAERRLLGPLSVRRAVPVTEIEVEEWYHTVPGILAGRADPRTYLRGRRLHAAALGVAVAGAVVITVGLGEIVLASVAAARFVQSVSPRAAELNAGLRRLSVADPYAEARRLLTPYLPAQAPLAEFTTDQLVRQLFNLERLRPLPTVPAIDARLLLGPGEVGLHEAVRRAYDRTLPPETAALVAALGEHPRVEAFRTLGRASSVDFLGALLDRPILRYVSVDDILPPSMAPLLQVAHLNALGAIAELQQGNVAGARARLGEGAAVALHVLESPLLGRHAYSFLRRDVLLPLASLAEVEGRSDEARALRSVRDALATRWAGIPGAGIAGLAAEAPAMPHFARAVIHGPLSAGERADLLMDGWAGLCANPREILGGPSGARHGRLFAIADSVGSRHARDLLLLARRRWAEPASALGAAPGLFGAVANRGPWAVTLRLLLCTDYAAP